MRGDGLREAIELHEHSALIKPAFIDARRQCGRYDPAACGMKCRDGELAIRSESLLVTYRAVRGNPICLSHSFYPSGLTRRAAMIAMLIRNTVAAATSAQIVRFMVAEW